MRILASLLFVVGLAACKQGVGEICQTNSDCASNACSHVAGQTYQHCVENASGGNIDANGTQGIDGAPADAPTDAATDAAAPIDAPIDAP